MRFVLSGRARPPGTSAWEGAATNGSAPGESPASGAGTGRRGAVTHFGMAVLSLILFLTFLDNTIISAVLANVQSSFHAGVAALQWVVGAYALTFAGLMLTCGTLGDLFGRKKVMLAGVAVFCAGSVVCALATGTAELVGGRVIMGIGAAASEPGTLSMLRHLYPERRRRARALGVWAAVSGLALALGPVIGGVLVGLWSWRAVFWFNLVFGAVAFVAGTIVLPESADPSRAKLDVGGFILGALAIGSATFATIAGESSGYIKSPILAIYAISILALIAFVAVERRAENPMLNVRYFSRRPFTGALVVAFTTYFSIFSIFFFVALYLEEVGSTTPYTLALDFLPLVAGMVIAALATGRWVAAVGAKVPMVVGCLVAAAGVILTEVVITPHAGPLTIGWPLAIAGIGFGIAIVPVTSSALTALPGAHSGMAASGTNTARELGAVAGVAILGSVVNGQLTVQLVKRLTALHIPKVFQSVVITDVTTGSISANAAKFENGNNRALQVIIDKVVGAAYGAFSHGLDLALLASGALLAASAVLALFTAASVRERPSLDRE